MRFEIGTMGREWGTWVEIEPVALSSSLPEIAFGVQSTIILLLSTANFESRTVSAHSVDAPLVTTLALTVTDGFEI